MANLILWNSSGVCVGMYGYAYTHFITPKAREGKWEQGMDGYRVRNGSAGVGGGKEEQR